MARWALVPSASTIASACAATPSPQNNVWRPRADSISSRGVTRSGVRRTHVPHCPLSLDVLLVPTSAIKGSFLAPFVRVSVNGRLVERPVEIGSSDDFHVIVTSGLAEHEQVVMPAPSASSTELANFAFGGANAQQFLRQIQSGGGGFGTQGGGGTRRAAGGGNGGGGN